MSNIIGLPGVQVQTTIVDPELLSIVENLLEETRAGKYVAIAFCAQSPDKGAATVVHRGPTGSIFALAGALSWLHYRVQRMMEEAP